MKKAWFAIATVLALGIGPTDAFAWGHGAHRHGRGGGHHGGFHGHHGGYHGSGWHHRRTVLSYRPYVYAGPSSCYRTEWIGGPRWRRVRRVFICG